MGKCIPVVHGIGAFISADQQDVQHIFVRKGAALRHLHFVICGLGQAGGIQVLVLLGINGANAVHRAVIVMNQIQLAVNVQHRQQHQHRQRRSKHRQQFQPQGTFLFVRRFRCCGFRLGFVFSSRLGRIRGRFAFRLHLLRLGLLPRGSRLHLVFFVLHNYFHPCCFWPRKRRRPVRIPQE